MQIKYTMRYYLTSTKMAIIKKTSAGENIKKLEPSHTAGENIKQWGNSGKQLGNFLKH